MSGIPDRRGYLCFDILLKPPWPQLVPFGHHLNVLPPLALGSAIPTSTRPWKGKGGGQEKLSCLTPVPQTPDSRSQFASGERRPPHVGGHLTSEFRRAAGRDKAGGIQCGYLGPADRPLRDSQARELCDVHCHCREDERLGSSVTVSGGGVEAGPTPGLSSTVDACTAPGCSRSGAKWQPGGIGGLVIWTATTWAGQLTASPRLEVSGPTSWIAHALRGRGCLLIRRERARLESAAGFICSLATMMFCVCVCVQIRQHVLRHPAYLRKVAVEEAAFCDRHREGWGGGYIRMIDARGSRLRRSSCANGKWGTARRRRPAGTKRSI